jgi:hypothetical protein
MILDGNLNPVAWSSGSSRVPALVRMDSSPASAATMRAFLDLCGRASTAACAFSAGTPAATTAKWDTLLRRLRRHPVTLGSPPQTFTYADTVVSVNLGKVAQWQGDAGQLQQLWIASTGGHPAPPAASSATAPSGPAPTGPSYYTGEEQTLAIFCADSPNPRNPAAYAAAAASGTFAPIYAWNTEGCADWPAGAAQDRYTGPWNRPTASTILLLANTGDPITAPAPSTTWSATP